MISTPLAAQRAESGALFEATVDSAKAQRVLPSISVQSVSNGSVGRAATVPLASIRPATLARVGKQPPMGAWLLLVLDPQAASSASFLTGLQTEKFSGTRTVVVLLGNQAAAERLVQQNLPVATRPSTATASPSAYIWTYGNRSALKTLRAGGTPMVYALNARDQVIWQHSGVPKKLGNLVLQMSDWISIRGQK